MFLSVIINLTKLYCKMEKNKKIEVNNEKIDVKDNSDSINQENEEKLKNTQKNKVKTDYLKDLQRLQAEFENFMKRTELEKQEIIKYSNEKLIFKLLNVLDSFQLALKHNNDEGVKLIYSELITLLESEGLSKIKTNGDFDLKFHEALIQEEGEFDNKIILELQPGYMLKEKVIRPAKVKITRKIK